MQKKSRGFTANLSSYWKHFIMNFIVALQAEARPLIDKFKLQKSTKFKTFRIFHNTKHRLIVSGIGQVQAAAATGFLLGLLKDKAEALLNVGLAGHGKLTMGTYIFGKSYRK